jgi:hypothetical protein
MVNIRELPGELPEKLGERRRISEAAGADAVSWESLSGKGIRLWNPLDDKWTAVLPADRARDYYLRKVAVRCSACIFVGFNIAEVEAHIKGFLEKAEEHAGAELIPVIDGSHSGTACTGCNARFMNRRKQATQHLERFSAQAGQFHMRATAVTFRRYTLGPTEPAPASQNGAGAVVHQSEGRPRRATGSRRRGRRGGTRRR